MDILQLEHFVAVAEESSFTRAAERVLRTQPAVSRSIKILEDEIGTPLFTRDAPQLPLTEAGRTLLEYAYRILGLRDEATRHLTALTTLTGGSLSIAAYESVATYLLPGFVHYYVQRFPGIRVSILRANSAEIPHLVMDRKVDVGFIKEEPKSHHLRSTHVYSDKLILVASPQHPFAGRRGVQLRDVMTERFVLHHLCPSTEQRVFRLFEAHGGRCCVAAEFSDFETVKDFVQRDGLALVPRITAMEELTAGKLVAVAVDGLDIERRTRMVHGASTYLSDAARHFIDVVRQVKVEQREAATLPSLPPGGSFPKPAPTSPLEPSGAPVLRRHGSPLGHTSESCGPMHTARAPRRSS